MNNHGLAEVKEFRLKLYPKHFEVSRAFYKDVLGWTVSKEWDHGPEDKGIMFVVGTTTLELLSPIAQHLSYAGSGVSLEVPNVSKLAEFLRDKCQFMHDLRHNEWGDTSFEIADPEGYPITFFTKD